MSHIVFVYGILKRGQPNYHVITNEDNGSATLVSMAKTVEKWTLVIATRFNVPFLLKQARTWTCIVVTFTNFWTNTNFNLLNDILSNRGGSRIC